MNVVIYKTHLHNRETLAQLLKGDAPKSHQGLRFEKFFALKDEKCNAIKSDELAYWLNKNQEIGKTGTLPNLLLAFNDNKLLEKFNKRLSSIIERNKGENFSLNLVSRLFIGIGLPHPTENGFLFHPTLGVPYIPGTALKQIARNYAKLEGVEEEILSRIFGGIDANGNPDNSGTIIFLDAIPQGRIKLVAEQITNHYSGYYQDAEPRDVPNRDADWHNNDMHMPADWHEPIPISLLALEASLTNPVPFNFGVMSTNRNTKNKEKTDLKNAVSWLTEGLCELGAGARTTLGFGRFLSENRKCKDRNLLDNIEKEVQAKNEASKNAQSQNATPTPTNNQRLKNGDKVMSSDGQKQGVVTSDEKSDGSLKVSWEGRKEQPTFRESVKRIN